MDKAFRTLGFTPTDYELRDIQKTLDRQGKKFVDEDLFIEILGAKMGDKDSAASLTKAF